VFWDDDATAGRWAREALGHATVAVGNQQEVAVAVGSDDPLEASAALLELGVAVAIVKRGSAGVLARTAGGVVEVDAVPCEVVNGLGAGDAFGGALVHALIEGWSLEHAIRFANAAGSFVAARFACADAMPTIEDLADHVPAVPA
jgi:5-dehydro-2-deoxygluconokinase